MRSVVAPALRASYLRTRLRGTVLRVVRIGAIRPGAQAFLSRTRPITQPISNQRITTTIGTKNNFRREMGEDYPRPHKTI